MYPSGILGFVGVVEFVEFDCAFTHEADRRKNSREQVSVDADDFREYGDIVLCYYEGVVWRTLQTGCPEFYVHAHK